MGGDAVGAVGDAPWGCVGGMTSWGVGEGPRAAEEEVARHDVVVWIAEGMGREKEESIGGRNGSYEERLDELVPMLSGRGRA